MLRSKVPLAADQKMISVAVIGKIGTDDYHVIKHRSSGDNKILLITALKSRVPPRHSIM